MDAEIIDLTVHRRTYQNRVWINRFWKRSRGLSRARRLELLREFAAIQLVPDPYVPHNGTWTRRNFAKRKQNGAFRLDGSCWVCRRERPDHRHHIIPVAAGGRNRKANIVNLCLCCHRAVHAK